MYLILSWPLNNWIIDDAGISFAYARNLAQGDGLVSWPGNEPVEGYSNFLWVLILSLLHFLHLFSPVITSKILGIFAIVVTCYLVIKITRSLQLPKILGLIMNILLLTNAPVLIWTSSGLENGLILVLAFMLILQTLNYMDAPGVSRTIGISLTAFLIVLSRPEGILYSLMFPLVIIWSGGFRQKWRHLIYYAVPLGILVSSYFMWKYFYFGSIIPNTYYAKQGNYLSFLASSPQPLTELLGKIRYLSYSIGGNWALPVFVVLHLAIFLQLFSFNKNGKTYVLLFTFLIAELAFMLMANDWMGELRFATTFIATSYLLLGMNLYLLIKKLRISKVLVGLFSLGFICYHLYHFTQRIQHFKEMKVASFITVKEYYADRFNHYNQIFGLQNASILLPDIGAMLYYSNIQVYDAAGLCDPVIAKNIHSNQQVLHQYIFETIQPTFISIHGRWAYLYNLDSDPRFRKYYTPISEGIDPHIRKHYQVEMLSGNYILKTAKSGISPEVWEHINDPYRAFDD